MKRLFNYIIILFLIIGTSQELFAVRAYPDPIKVQQPDGSYITIQVHGDEFLNWTTSGGRLVSKKSDGFYYYANFNAQGYVVASPNKVSAGNAISYGNSNVIPPQIAFERARQMRDKIYSLQSSIKHTSGASLQSVSIGNNKFLVILAEFQDREFTYTNQDFTNLLNQANYSENGGTGSAKDYFEDNSNGDFTPTFDVAGPYKVDNNYAYYGEGSTDPYISLKFVEEVVKLADTDINFADYDNDNDGRVDNVFIFFAGYNAAEGDGAAIWPHRWSLWNKIVSVDGKRVYDYACTSELRGASGTTMAGIGTFCHEFSHVLGLPDFYDTDYESNGQGWGLGQYSLMSSGNYKNNGKTPPYYSSEERGIVGWMGAPTELTTSGNYTLESVENDAAYFIPTNNPGEYYLFESRQGVGWDAGLPSGMIVYHVDKSENIIQGSGGLSAKYLWDNTNKVNAYGEHECMRLVKADGTAQYSNDPKIPFPGSSNKTSLTATTTPASLSWAGSFIGYDITNISNSGGVSFTLTENMITYSTINGVVKNQEGEALPNATVKIEVLGSPVVEKICDSEGKFTHQVELNSTVRMYASYYAYNDYSNTFTADAATKDIILTLSRTSDLGDELKKHRDLSTSIGGGSLGQSTYAGAGFSAEELETVVGKQISNIKFMVGGTTATKLDVVVYFDNVEAYRKSVTSPLFNVMNNVDIREGNVVIPADKQVIIGYHIEGSDDAYPILGDAGPYIKLGALLSITSSNPTWSELPDLNSSLAYNLIISADLIESKGPLANAEIGAISATKSEYNVGESFKLECTPFKEGVSSINWTFNGVSRADGSVVTLVAGTHKVIATINYSDGGKETVTYEVVVK